MTDQPSTRWAETVDTDDGGATIRIPAYAPDGSETDGLLLTRADAIVLRNMLSSLLADGTCICGTSPDPGICHGGCNSGRASGGHCRCACGGGGHGAENADDLRERS